MNIEISTFAEVCLAFIAIVSAIIAWQQYTANRERLRLELYDKRFKIYHVIINFIYKTAYSGESPKNDGYFDFITACNEVQFLVPNTDAQVKNAKKIIDELKLQQRRLERRNLPEDKRNEYIDRICDLEKELENSGSDLTKAFSEYLKFNKF